VQRRERHVAGFLSSGHVGEHRLGQPRRAGQQSSPFGGVGSDQRRLKQLAHDAEPEPALQLPAPRRQGRHVLRGGASAKLLEQHSLSDACGPLDQQDAAGACDRIRQGRIDGGQVILAIE
jgi:hypothetical protein